MKRLEHGRQPVVAGVALGGDAEHRFAPARHLDEIALERADLVERRLGALAEMLAEPRGNHAPAGPLEQRAADPSFEIGELMAQRGLREIELLSGACEVSLFRDRRHEAEVTNLEAHVSKILRTRVSMYAGHLHDLDTHRGVTS